MYILFSIDKILDDDLVLVTHRRSQKKYACKGIAYSFYELLYADFSIIVFISFYVFTF
jgi:ABC-type tungstate transport system permease subunit